MDSKHKIGFILTIGIPGSGKSTLISMLTKYFIDQENICGSKYEAHTISYDKLIPVSVQCGNSEGSWRGARKMVMQQVESLVCQLKENALLPENQHPNHVLIFIDDNMYYRSMRYEYFQLARSYGLSFCQIHVSCTVEQALEHNGSRIVDSVPEEVVLKMFAKLELPDPTHNRWESSSLTVISQSIDTDEVCSFIKLSLDCPVPPIVRQQLLEVKSSIIHNADILLRKLVGKIMREAQGNGEQLSTKAASLNSLRQSILERLRVGDLSLPDNNCVEFLNKQMECDANCIYYNNDDSS